MISQSSKNAFTLIELMVVISIISLFSSIVLGGVTIARAKSRDSHRIGETRQFQDAIHIYASTAGKVPTLQGTCGEANFDAGDTTIPGNCVASSNAPSGTPQAVAWGKLMLDLVPTYLSAPIKDPCPGCTSSVTNTTSIGQNVGFVYVAPAAVHYYCNTGSNSTTPFCTGRRIDGNTYEAYVAPEIRSTLFGVSSQKDVGETCFLISMGVGGIPQARRHGLIDLFVNTASASVAPSSPTFTTLGSGC